MKRRTMVAVVALVAGAGAGAAAAWMGSGRPVPAPASPPAEAARASAMAQSSDATSVAESAADPARGADVFHVCSACHSIGRGGPDVDGPNLYGVVGAPVAERRPRYGYTQALRDVSGIWTEQRLEAWLTNPVAFAPGTAMHFAGLDDAKDRADVIAYLATQGPRK
ncbi:MAG: c-type cytochrome [Janthinobacterium lividum]